LIEIIKKYNIDLIIPSWDFDVYKWSDNIEILNKTGTTVLLNNRELIDLCQDKWSFFMKLSESNCPHLIPSSISQDYEFLIEEFGKSLMLKPRTGTGSKDIVTIKNKDDFLLYKNDIGKKLMVQPVVGNEIDEYTTAAFCDGKGGFSCHISLQRKLTKLGGFTDRAWVVELEGMEKVLKNLCEIFKPIGPTNFQFRKDKGQFYLLEINPRISSATSIRTAFGYNECEYAMNYYLEGTIPIQPKIRKGRAVRYMEDFIEYEE
jgi:carbamoyl-phosphate synthase large subunit